MLIFKNAVLKPVMEELQEKGGNLLFCEKRRYLPDGRIWGISGRMHIAYADDFDPRLPENEYWYENAGLELGYDDFGEPLGSDFWGTFINQVLDKGCDVFIDVTETQLRAGFIEH
ncbi:DUF3085 domain-containing protein [Yersinia sp. 2544 StPb PI]|uniref:DUF3085 domain-containing protein n=1 Tax=Yersinia sp. 2544 StPb PI TaxID=3117409 RepID=UPI003B28CACB